MTNSGTFRGYFAGINVKSIRFRLTVLIVVLSVILLGGASFELYQSFTESEQTNQLELRNNLSNSLNIATGIQAIERGVGSTIIGGNRTLLDEFNDLGLEGDAHTSKVEAFSQEILRGNNAPIDFEKKYILWRESQKKLRESRLLVISGDIKAKAWFENTTNNILMEFDLQNVAFTPNTVSESALYYDTVLRPNIALLAEYAGRERAVLANIISSNVEISSKDLALLESYRSHVNRAVRRVQVIKDDQTTPPKLRQAIVHFENVFLGDYQKLRQKVYRASADNNQRGLRIKAQLQEARAMVHDDLLGINTRLSTLTTNDSLQSLVKGLLNGQSEDTSRAKFVFKGLADLEPKYNQLRYLDDVGDERLRIDYVDGINRIVPDNELQSKADRYYFIESRNLAQGEYYLSRLDLNVDDGKISTPFLPMLRFASPVFVDDKRHGVVVMNFNAGEFLKNFPDGMTMADQDGFYLHHPDDDREWGMMEELGRQDSNLVTDLPNFKEAVKQGTSERILVGGQGFFVLPIYYYEGQPDKYWLLVFQHDHIPYPVDGVEWIEASTNAINTALAVSSIIGEMAVTSIVDKKENALINEGLSLAVLLILVLILFTFFKELFKFVSKTEAINEKLDLLAAGDLSQRINISGKSADNGVSRDDMDEIDFMGANINQMAVNLEVQSDRLHVAKENAENANEAKTKFLSSMSHELRTPLNAIIGFGQMLDFNPDEPLTKDQKSSVDHILGGGRHLLELINQVLELAKIEVGELSISLEAVNPNAIGQECLSLISTQAKVRNLNVSGDLHAAHPIMADYTRIKQVLFNLLSNGVKYNRTGGSLSLVSEDTSQGTVRMSVIDTGEGIPEDQREGLFEPFNRLGKEASDIEGTGIGLTVTKELVEAMGGTVGFESTVGTGSTFWIEFPVSEGTVAIIEDGEADIGNVASDRDELIYATVLYVEDNPANLQLMKKVIKRMGGITLIWAGDAELGIEMSEEHRPDLILMDINLPGMNGIEAKEELAKNVKTKDIPVIAISAAAMKSDIAKGMAAGFKSYLTKPFDIPEVIKSIENELRSLNSGE